MAVAGAGGVAVESHPEPWRTVGGGIEPCWARLRVGYWVFQL